MHITVSVVVIMFELTGALTYILPTMIVVGVTKAVSELFGSGGIADRMIWFSGFPFLDNKEDHNFGVPVSQAMTTDVVAIPTTGMTLKAVEGLLAQDQYQGFPIVEDENSNILVGYVGRTELRYAVDRVKRERSLNPLARCTFGTPSVHSVTPTPFTPTVTTGGGNPFDSAASSTSIDFSRYVDTTPVTVHPRLPLETVMELFRKIGPRVILIEYRGHLAGLVTVKDCLKYQFKAEAAENPRDDHHIVEGQEKLWGVIRRVGDWVSDKVSSVSRGRIQLRESFDADGGISRGGDAGGHGHIMDGTEELLDDEAVELEAR
jgi:chloride channel 3/4/5